MKKIFVTICFTLIFASMSYARITPISEYKGSLQMTDKNQKNEIKAVQYDEFVQFIKNNAKNITLTKPENVTNKSVSILSKDKSNKDSNKTIFQKIYENAIERVSQKQETQRFDVYETQQDYHKDKIVIQQDLNVANTPVIKIKLPPNNMEAIAPAQEHIPYLMSAIEVLNNGLVKIQETAVVIANGEKLQKGLTKILPSQIKNQQGKKQILDYSIISVTRNDELIDYRLISLGDRVGLAPVDNQFLAPGVYTYKFEYLIDNLLIDNNETYLLYWNGGGCGWNLVVDRLGMTLILPQQNALLGHQVWFGSEANYYNDSVLVSKNGISGMAYRATRPLYVGEGMFLVAEIDKKAMVPLSMWQKFMHLFYQYGDIILSVVGLFAITFSLFISWIYIKAQKKIQKISLPKTAMIMRYLLTGKIDIKSIGICLLEMYGKNIIDIQQAGETILLIKRTDDLKKTSFLYPKAVKALFPAQETIFNVNKNNQLMFKRFFNSVKSDLQKQMAKFKCKLILGYAVISWLMLFLIEGAIAYFKISSCFVWGVLVVASLVSGLLIMLWNINLPKLLKYIYRLIAIIGLITSWIIMSAVVHPISSAFLLLIIVVIVTALHYYAQKYGLIRYYINDVQQQREKLVKNAENIVLDKSYLYYQSMIFAFDLEKDVIPIKKDENYKIEIVNAIIKVFN